MKPPFRLISAALVAFTFSFVAGCTTVPVPVTSGQQLAAQSVDDALSVVLVPVLVKNSTYIPAAAAVADALGAVSGDQFTPADTDGVLSAAKRKGYAFSADDERMIRATINAAWDRYAKNYQTTIGAGVRPDVKLFASAAADGIRSAAQAAANAN